MSFQDEMNRLANTTGRSIKDCMAVMAGDPTNALNRSTQRNCQLWLGVPVASGKASIQDMLNVEAGTVGLTKQDAAKLLT